MALGAECKITNRVVTSLKYSIATRIASSIATWIFTVAQHTRFRGVGGYSAEAFEARKEERPYPQATRESNLFRDFFSFFTSSMLESAIGDKVVLDFGCGYGGRTVDYARKTSAAFVWGVEPVQRHVDLASAYARSLNISNVAFRLCGQRDIPLPDSSVDVVVSYDVLEHVQSPVASVEEIYRVLRPGGLAFLVFPVYLGLRSHHLDYITTLPGLHWVFSAQSLVLAVNHTLALDSDMRMFGTKIQPDPQRSFDNRRYVLPMLNGLSGRHLATLFSKFIDVEIRRHVVLRSKPKLAPVTRLLSARFAPVWLQDAVTDSVSCVMRKPMQM
jgi:SAM-dependent methyltransferase